MRLPLVPVCLAGLTLAPGADTQLIVIPLPGGAIVVGGPCGETPLERCTDVT